MRPSPTLLTVLATVLCFSGSIHAFHVREPATNSNHLVARDTTCPPEQFLSGSTCLPCPDLNSCAGGTTQPVPCPPNSPIASPNHCGCPAPLFFLPSTDSPGCLRVCDGGGFDCRDPHCPVGQEFVAISGCRDCPAGTHLPVINPFFGCLPCPANTFSANPASTTCDPCPDGLSSNPGASICTFMCPAGSFDNSGVCQTCPAGQISAAAATSCIPCDANEVPNDVHTQCVACPPGFVSASGDATCTPQCLAGSIPNGTACDNCPSGTFSQTGNTTCTPCGANQVSQPGADSCTPCTNGEVPNGDASACVVVCTAGQIISNNQCTNCTAGSFSGLGATSCTPCPVNTFSDAQASSCTDCPSGSTSPEGSAHCTTQCPDGQTPSNGQCVNCPKNTYGHDNICTPCPQGHSSPPGSTSCHLRHSHCSKRHSHSSMRL